MEAVIDSRQGTVPLREQAEAGFGQQAIICWPQVSIISPQPCPWSPTFSICLQRHPSSRQLPVLTSVMSPGFCQTTQAKYFQLFRRDNKKISALQMQRLLNDCWRKQEEREVRKEHRQSSFTYPRASTKTICENIKVGFQTSFTPSNMDLVLQQNGQEL